MSSITDGSIDCLGLHHSGGMELPPADGHTTVQRPLPKRSWMNYLKNSIQVHNDAQVYLYSESHSGMSYTSANGEVSRVRGQKNWKPYTKPKTSDQHGAIAPDHLQYSRHWGTLLPKLHKSSTRIKRRTPFSVLSNVLNHAVHTERGRCHCHRQFDLAMHLALPSKEPHLETVDKIYPDTR